MRRNNKPMFAVLSLLVSIVAVGVVYAGFTGTLNVNGTGNVIASKWDIYFANLSNATTTGTANVVTPATINPKTKIGDYYVELASLGDSVTYTFDVVNDGDFDAVLTSLTKGTPTCSPSATICNYLTYTLTYTSGGATVAENDTLASGETKNMTLKLMLHSDTPASALSSTELSVSNLGITLLYSQSSSLNNGGSSGGGSTPVEPPISCFIYLISNNTVVIKGYDSINCPQSIIIPSEIEGYPVTTLGKGNYSSSSGRLTSVVILNTVIEIGDGVFNNNKLPDNQAFIYARTDSNYDGVAEIDNTTIVSYGGANKNPVIQNNVIIIGLNAFTNNQLTSVIIKTKTSSSEFSKYGNYPWGWASDVTCVKNNTSNVTNGCITWGAS